jgi:two-component system OmpR family response regulator
MVDTYHAAVRVLVVEDEPRMAALLRRSLQEEGYQVDIASDGDVGLWQASEHDYDAILLDLTLPGLDGVGVCAALRAAGLWTPVVMLTARHRVEDRIRGLDAGADDYLTKPFSVGELTARLRAVLRRGAPARGETLEVDSLRLDPATHQVWRGEQTVELTAKEFALLELLMRHPGEVLSRTYIREHVWDFAYESGSNVVDQYIAYLRRKVDRPFALRQVDTVRGLGYRLRATAHPAS